jgi:hypothetical protein
LIQPLDGLLQIDKQLHRQHAQRTFRQPRQVGLIELRQVVPRQLHGSVSRLEADGYPSALLAA